MATVYKEFEWNTTEAGNGESGIGLTKAFIEVVQQIKGVETICDLGCGNRYMDGLLAAKGYRVTGVDASETGIRIAQQNHSDVTFVQSLIDASLSQRLAGATFDLVVSSDVIEHFYRPADLIEAAASILKPQGQLVVGTPYHGYLKNLALSVSGKMDSHFTSLDDGGHIKFFSVKTLSQLLTNYGFSVLGFSYYGRAPKLWKNMICVARKN